MSDIGEQDEQSFVDPDDDRPKWVRKLASAADAARDTAEDRVDRLAGDRELANALKEADYEGRDYDLFANEIAKYGWAVIRGWIYKGQIGAEVKKKGFGALEPEPRRGAMVEDAESLSDETIVRSLRAFRETVLVPGRWDPARGASLRTFFVGQCLRQFSNVYRTWRRGELRTYVEPHDFDANHQLDEFEDGPLVPTALGADETAQVRDELRRVLGKVTDERARMAFYLSIHHGFTHAQIGEKLTMTGKAVESALARARKQINEGRESA